ncbi:MAG: DsbA family protein, partial [Myxococcota bacterium]
LRGQIREYLRDQEVEARRLAFLAPLREASGVEILLRPPVMPVNNEGAPARGPASATVTLVEFGDFQCPYCRTVQPTLERILADYPEQVRLVFRHFPLDGIHPQSRAAAEAAACAGEHGEFWTYHDLLFENQDALGPAELVDYADRAGIDLDAFRRCVDERQSTERVERDIRAGEVAGVSGTPALLINGRPLTGPPDYENLRKRIEAELN